MNPIDNCIGHMMEWRLRCDNCEIGISNLDCPDYKSIKDYTHEQRELIERKIRMEESECEFFGRTR